MDEAKWLKQVNIQLVAGMTLDCSKQCTAENDVECIKTCVKKNNKLITVFNRTVADYKAAVNPSLY